MGKLTWFDLLEVYKRIYDSDILEAEKKIFSYNYALLILEALYRAKYCDGCRYTIKELKVLKKNNVRLNKSYTLKQNMKLLFFLIFPNISMKYKRRNIKHSYRT